MQLDTSYFFIKAIIIHLTKIKSRKQKYSKENKKKAEKVLLLQQTVIFCPSRNHSKQFRLLLLCCGVIILFALSVIHSDHLHSLNSLDTMLNKNLFLKIFSEGI